jgi:uncharacterized protein YggL (DUF469 family)
MEFDTPGELTSAGSTDISAEKEKVNQSIGQFKKNSIFPAGFRHGGGGMRKRLGCVCESVFYSTDP